MDETLDGLLDKVRKDCDLTNFTVLSHHDDSVVGQGTRLVQLNRPNLGTLSGVFVAFPVKVSLETHDRQTPRKIQVEEISEDDVEEAVLHLQRLARCGQIETGSEATRSKATHAIEIDDKGRRVLVRLRYS